MGYILYNEDLDAKIQKDPAGFLLAERVDVLQWKISTFADEKESIVPACDLMNKIYSDNPFNRTVVCLSDPSLDLTVSSICDNEPFLYPKNMLDYNLLFMLKCRQFETEFGTWAWDAPGMWYNNGQGIADFWRLAQK